jgi:hypothetical protein
VAPEHADADVQLRVTGNYDQTHFINVPIRGFADITAAAIPAPIPDSGTVDGWRATRVLAGRRDRRQQARSHPAAARAGLRRGREPQPASGSS